MSTEEINKELHTLILQARDCGREDHDGHHLVTIENRIRHLSHQSHREYAEEQLSRLYSDLDFHHVYRSQYSLGDFDDGGHKAIDLVKREINRQLTELRAKNEELHTCKCCGEGGCPKECINYEYCLGRTP